MNLDDRPKLARKARVRLDRIEQRHVLLSPERGLELNASAARIVALCDGVRTVTDIVSAIAEASGAPPETVEADVLAFLGDVEARGLLERALP